MSRATTQKLSKTSKICKILSEERNNDKNEKSDIKEDKSFIEDKKNTSLQSSEKRTKELNYKKLQLKEQILLRPDTYIGSTKRVKSDESLWVLENKENKENKENNKINKFIQKQVTFTEGFIRLFVEIVSNAIDNVWRSVEFGIPCKFIKIEINREKGIFKVWNDGKTIPIEKHKDENIYIPEMIFGHFLTSSNYDDTEERKTSGRNGIGGTCANLFSKLFEVECFHPDVGIYNQTWKNNMNIVSDPSISTVKSRYPKTVENGKNGYTCVSYTPELSRFDMSDIDDDTMQVLEKYIVDTAMIVSKYSVKVFYNDKEIVMKGYKDYIKYYFEELPEELIILSESDNICIVCPFQEYTQVSFVNGINTKDGGVHVDAWCEQLFRPLVNKLNEKFEKKKKFDMRDVKKHFFVFVNCFIDKPRFDNQNKTKLNSPTLSVEVKPAVINKLMKWDFMDTLKESIKSKEIQHLKGETERKRNTVKVEGLDDANFAGKTGKSQECILCITEGLSAKTYVVKGMKYGIFDKKGHDYIGVLPIRGKFVNVRNASVSTIIKNKEVKALIQAIGLQHGADYTKEENKKKLRYGKFVAIGDSDSDGLHITGLLYNFFDVLFPTLLQNNDFFYFMRTPIMKISDKKITRDFYFYQEAQNYIIEKKPKKDNIRYFKGLGTSNNDDVKNDFGKKMVKLECKEESKELINNIFSKDESDFRKNWLAKFNPITNMPNTNDSIDIADFINKELITFSVDDCKRSIPCMLDGLKESQRKVLFAAIKRNLSYNNSKCLKVAQFAGYVAEHTSYHHGEQNLYDTITKMAQTYMGSNNIPLLYEEGAFGSLLECGNDAASGRYIYTKLAKTTRYIFREEDDDFLENRFDDGDIIEKKHYCPIVPYIVVNGCFSGIGTGWSCSVPPHNIKDVINWIKTWIKRDGDDDEKIDVELKPFFNKFKGKVEVQGKKIITTGVITKKDKNYIITEVPVGRKNMSITKMKERLEELKEEGYIKSIKDQSTENDVHFTISLVENVEDEEEKQLIEKIGLNDCMHTSNMVLFDKDEKIKKYDTVYEIMNDFCNERYDMYKRRKQGILKSKKTELKFLKNKYRFIKEVVDGQINIKEQEDDALLEILEDREYDLKEGKYEYLVSIQMRHITKTKINELDEQIKKLQDKINEYSKKTEKSMWLEELKELENLL
jgi:DNA topoisomerase-2